MTYRRGNCEDHKMFPLKTGTIVECSKLGYEVWAIANNLLTTNLKGVSSLQLHRDLGITQRLHGIWRIGFANLLKPVV